MVMVQLAPLPSRIILPAGTRVVLELAARTPRLAIGTLAAPTVKAMGPVEVSSLMVTSYKVVLETMVISTDTVTILESNSPSLTLKVKLSVPSTSVFGV